jgi:hypothetical protein
MQIFEFAQPMEVNVNRSIKTGIVNITIGTVIVFFLTLAATSLTTSSVMATPQIGKGKPCTTCHEGTPPSKGNVKK